MTTIKVNCNEVLVQCPSDIATSLDEQIDIIKEQVNHPELLKAVVTVTTIMKDDTISHFQLDVDNESDVEKIAGFVTIVDDDSDLNVASNLYRRITELSNMRIDSSDIIEIGDLKLDLNTD